MEMINRRRDPYSPAGRGQNKENITPPTTNGHKMMRFDPDLN